MNSQVFLVNLMKKIEFPEEAEGVFLELYQRIVKDSAFTERMKELVHLFMEKEYGKAFEDTDRLAEDMGIHEYTMSMLLLLLCTEPLYGHYQGKGLPEQLFLDTMKDLTYKLNECKQVYDIWGNFVRSWYPGFYEMTRFALGRMQYEYEEFKLEEFKKGGITVRKGDRVINMHIPSCGAFTWDIRLDSYRKAYEFYKGDFNGKPIPMVCDSWLLYPGHREFLPERLNIRGFMNDFSYIEGFTRESFEDAWRVFGSDFKKAPEDLSRETSLQRAYAEHLEKGGKTGTGYGIFLFDGEKII